MLPCGRKNRPSYDTDKSIKDIQRYVTFKEDTSKETQKNDYEFFVTVGSSVLILVILHDTASLSAAEKP